MTIKKEIVKTYFNNTSQYIDTNVIIMLRKYILKSHLYEIRDKKIVDLGCGNGAVSIDFIKNNTVSFVDLSSKKLDEVL